MFSKKREKQLIELKKESKPPSSMEDFEKINIKEWKEEEAKEYSLFESSFNKKIILLLTLLYNKYGWNLERDQFCDDVNNNMKRAFYIVKNRINAPRSSYFYHGTSSLHYMSIQQNGLNNGLNREINEGVISHLFNGVTYCTDFHQAFEFAEGTAAKVGGIPIVIRWQSIQSQIKGEVGVTPAPVNPESLEFCVDEENMEWSNQIPEALRSPKRLRLGD